MSEGKYGRIVVAEDSSPNRKILVHLLEKLGFGVDSFENGKEAWDFLNGDAKDIKAIISDIMMPEMDGIEFLKEVRESDKYKEIPFVLVTAVSDKNYILEAKKLKVNGYILKPVSFNKVSAKIKDLFPEVKIPNIAA